MYFAPTWPLCKHIPALIVTAGRSSVLQQTHAEALEPCAASDMVAVGRSHVRDWPLYLLVQVQPL